MLEGDLPFLLVVDEFLQFVDVPVGWGSCCSLTCSSASVPVVVSLLGLCVPVFPSFLGFLFAVLAVSFDGFKVLLEVVNWQTAWLGRGDCCMRSLQWSQQLPYAVFLLFP